MVGDRNLSKSKIKDNHMDKFTQKASFEQWFSPLNETLFEELVKTHQLNYSTKKLYMILYEITFYAQLHVQWDDCVLPERISAAVHE